MSLDAHVSASAPIFALDIGTRNLVGIIAVPEGDKLTVQAVAMADHAERAMRDGQIHDIPRVVTAVRAVKQALEEQLGRSLTSVAIAAAGRALQTVQARSSQEVGLQHAIDVPRVRALELAAIQEAVGRLSKEDFHCVGYSVVHYYLDGQPLSNLEGQRGKVIEVELIATFLPRVVTDSLVAVCHQSGLEVQNLTLEPIAAINAAVPSNMRALNLALIDIGAGTSDVAITQGGTVTAYAMVPQAGDSLTEGLAEAYLLDFLEAERVKYLLSGDGAVSFTDVLGLEHTFAAEAVRQQVRPILERLVQQIAQQILSLNGKAPSAAILIGGGSLFPGLGPLLAQALGLPENRVAVRGTEMVKRLETVPEALVGPMGVTPVGIALASLLAPGFRFLTVYLDDKVLNLEDWGGCKVVDALMAAGIDLRELAPKPQKMVSLHFNGEPRQYPSTPGAQVRLLMDGAPTTTDAPLHDGARLALMRPSPGSEESPLKVSDVASLHPVRVSINGLSMDFPPLVKVNGTSIMGDRHLTDGDTLLVDRTVRALMVAAGIAESPASVLRYTLNGEKRERLLSELRVRVDGAEGTLSSEVFGGETIEVKQTHLGVPSVVDVLPSGVLTLSLRLNDRPVSVRNPALEVLVDGEPAALDAEVSEGAEVRYQLSKTLTVADLLPMVQDELPEDAGDDLLLTVDGKFADLSTAITPESVIEVLIEEEGAPVLG